MTAPWWSAAAVLLLLAAVTAAWPMRRHLHRLETPASAGRRPPIDVAVLRARLSVLAHVRPGRLIGAGSAAAAGVGLVLGGWVAALVAAAYGALALRGVVRRTRRRREAAARSRSLDDLCSLAADLRAGLPPAAVSGVAAPDLGPVAADRATAARTLGQRAGFSLDQAFSGRASSPLGRLASTPNRADIGLGRLQVGAVPPAGRGASPAATPSDPGPDPRIAQLTAAVWRLAERTGAPAADLVERIEADARAADRAKASAAAQAAGAQATAILLAALPAGGIALGYSIGADPLRILLHTGLGAACALGAVALQCAGLLWADRLVTGAAQ